MSFVNSSREFVRRKHTPKCVHALRALVCAVPVWLRFWCSLLSRSLPGLVVSSVREFSGVRFSCSDLFFDVSEGVPPKEFVYLLTRLKIWQVLCSFSFLGEFLERSEISLFSLGQVRNFLGGIGHLHANFIWL